MRFLLVLVAFSVFSVAISHGTEFGNSNFPASRTCTKVSDSLLRSSSFAFHCDVKPSVSPLFSHDCFFFVGTRKHDTDLNDASKFLGCNGSLNTVTHDVLKYLQTNLDYTENAIRNAYRSTDAVILQQSLKLGKGGSTGRPHTEGVVSSSPNYLGCDGSLDIIAILCVYILVSQWLPMPLVVLIACLQAASPVKAGRPLFQEEQINSFIVESNLLPSLFSILIPGAALMGVGWVIYKIKGWFSIDELSRRFDAIEENLIKALDEAKVAMAAKMDENQMDLHRLSNQVTEVEGGVIVNGEQIRANGDLILQSAHELTALLDSYYQRGRQDLFDAMCNSQGRFRGVSLHGLQVLIPEATGMLQLRSGTAEAPKPIIGPET